MLHHYAFFITHYALNYALCIELRIELCLQSYT